MAGTILILLFSLAGALLLHRHIASLLTRMREAETALRTHSHRQELLLRHADQGVLGLDLEGRVTFINPAAEFILGRGAAEAVGQPLPLFRCGEEVRRTDSRECPVLQTLRDGMTRHGDEVAHRRDDETLEVEYSVAAVREEGRIRGAVMLLADVSERRRMERDLRQAEGALREREAALAVAQAQAHLGSWQLDIAANRLEWSDECYRIFGLALGTPLTYESFLCRVHPDDQCMVDTRWQEALAGAPYDIEHRILPGGEVRWVRERAELRFTGDGRLLGGVGTAQDITELKKKEQDLLQSRQTLRELAAHHEKIREEERSRIAREIHDELGQYLTALRMEAALLGMRFGESAPGIADHVKHMKEAIDTTIGVVRNVASALRPAVLDMGLVSAAEWLLTSFEERTGILCHLEAPQDLPGVEDAQGTAAFRILQESLTNVARHAQAGQVRVSIERGERALFMNISDDGQGFDPAEVRKKKTFGLMGIRERAMMFGGEARIESRPGAGTTVHITLPLQANHPGVAP